MIRNNKFRLRILGFTTLELVAVVGIMAIVLAILLMASIHEPTRSPASLAPIDSRLVGGRELFVDNTAADPSDTAPLIALYKNGKSLLTFTADKPEDGVEVPIDFGSDADPSERVLAIDSDVATGKLYAITSASRVVVLRKNAAKTQVTAVESTPLSQKFTDYKIKEVAKDRHFYIDSEGLFYNAIGQQEKWLRSDHDRVPSSYFYITPDGTLVQWGEGRVPSEIVARLCPAVYQNPELLVNADKQDISPPEQAALNNADKDRHFYRSSTDNFSYNAFGLGERWIKGQVGRKTGNFRSTPWYFITAVGVYEWDGSNSLVGSRSVPGISRTLAGKIYNDPSILFNANLKPNLVNGGIPQDYINSDRQEKFFFDRSGGSCRNLYEDGTFGLDIKWFAGKHNLYYFIYPDGRVFRWLGVGNQGSFVADLGPEAWDNIEQVVHANVLPRSEATKNLDLTRCLYRDCADTNYHYNSFGLQEKWIKGLPTAKATGRTNPWYFITPNGDLFEWDGGNNPGSSHRVQTGIPSTESERIYIDPNYLCDAYYDGTVFTSPVDYCSFEQSQTTPDIQCGDHLLDIHLAVKKGFGADMNPLSIPTGGTLPETLLFVADGCHSFNINVKTGLMTGNPQVMENTPGDTLLAAAAFDSLGGLFALNHETDPNTAGNDTFWAFNEQSGQLTNAFLADMGINSTHNVGLEILGTGIPPIPPVLPDGNQTFAVATPLLNGKFTSRLFTISRITGAAENPRSIHEAGVATPRNDVSDITIDCNPK